MAAMAGRKVLSGVARGAARRVLGSVLGGNKDSDSDSESGGHIGPGASLQHSARRDAACTVALHKGWGPDWKKHPEAKKMHKGLCCAAEKHAGVLFGKGLTKWKAEAIKEIRRLKRQRTKATTPRRQAKGVPMPGIDVAKEEARKAQAMKGGAMKGGMLGSPPGRFGVAPCVPEAPTNTAEYRSSIAALKKEKTAHASKMTHGTGANSRNSVGMPYNIDNFRRPVTSSTHGGGVRSSGARGDDVLPDRAMKSGLALEAEFKVEPNGAVLHNFGGNDGALEDITNYGLRPNPSSGMKLFKRR